VAENEAPSIVASIVQVMKSELRIEAHGTAALASESESALAGLVGTDAATASASCAGAEYLNLRKLTIYGGSNEIQRNIIAQMILGLYWLSHK